MVEAWRTVKMEEKYLKGVFWDTETFRWVPRVIFEVENIGIRLWAPNVFQHWPALLIPPVLFKTMGLFWGSFLGIVALQVPSSVSCRAVGWEVCRNCLQEPYRNWQMFFVCFVQRQHLQRGQDRGDGAAAEGGSGWETQTPGAQGERRPPNHCSPDP